jgi:antitoxin component YwqK of YwqJK toxin-antitoxin module
LKEGKPDGLGTMWYENGQKGSEVNYKDGKQDELEIRWDKYGREITSITYKNSKVVDNLPKTKAEEIN